MNGVIAGKGNRNEEDRRQYLELLAAQCLTNEDDALLYHLALHQGPDPYVQRDSHFDRLVLAERIRRGIEPRATEVLRVAEQAYRANPRDPNLDQIIQAEWVRRSRVNAPIEYLATFFLLPKGNSTLSRQKAKWRRAAVMSGLPPNATLRAFAVG
jgi:hypothetical protein